MFVSTNLPDQFLCVCVLSRFYRFIFSFLFSFSLYVYPFHFFKSTHFLNNERILESPGIFFWIHEYFLNSGNMFWVRRTLLKFRSIMWLEKQLWNSGTFFKFMMFLNTHTFIYFNKVFWNAKIFINLWTLFLIVGRFFKFLNVLWNYLTFIISPDIFSINKKIKSGNFFQILLKMKSIKKNKREKRKKTICIFSASFSVSG